MSNPIVDYYSIEGYSIEGVNKTLHTVKEFVCGTEYEIEDVRYIRFPGKATLYRSELNLSDNSVYWVGDFGLMHDGSLRNNGMEFITCPMSYNAALEAFKTLHGALELGPVPYSSRTSIHVHVNMCNMTMAHLKHLLLTYALLEPVYFAVAGENRKHNIHCVPLNFTSIPAHYSKPIQEIVKIWSKYSALNLIPIKSLGTVEFRHLYGTGDFGVYQQWLTLIKELWDFVYNNSPAELEKMLKKGYSPEEIQRIVLPSSKNIVCDFSSSIIDVKLAF